MHLHHWLLLLLLVGVKASTAHHQIRLERIHLLLLRYLGHERILLLLLPLHRLSLWELVHRLLLHVRVQILEHIKLGISFIRRNQRFTGLSSIRRRQVRLAVLVKHAKEVLTRIRHWLLLHLLLLLLSGQQSRLLWRTALPKIEEIVQVLLLLLLLLLRLSLCLSLRG